MSVRHRPMRPGDVRECVEILAADPVVGSRYGALVGQVRPTFLRLLGRLAFRAVVFEDFAAHPKRLVGLGISAFLVEAYVGKLKTAPLCWAGPDLVGRIVRGEDPILTDRQLRDANAGSGLHNFVWHGCTRLEERARPEVNHCVISAFVEQHRGFFLREVLAQAESFQTAQMILNTGGLLWNPEKHEYERATDGITPRLINEPHVLGLTRELGLAQIGSWVGSLFIYEAPQFGFRPSEQRLLTAAFDGGTDEDLARELTISVSAVKKAWQAIYQRIATVRPTLIPIDAGRTWTRERGKEKKQRLMAYLRDHPEELRPVSRRVLEQHRLRLGRTAVTSARR
jgi:hypothetical protein